MRQIVSLSLPAQTARKIKILSKQRGYKSVSHYVQNLVQADEDLITEKELLAAVRVAKSDYQKGNLVSARSMSDLL